MPVTQDFFKVNLGAKELESAWPEELKAKQKKRCKLCHGLFISYMPNRWIILFSCLWTLAVPGLAAGIHSAIQQGDVAAVQAVLDADRTLVSSRGEDGLTPLHEAVLIGRADLVRLLLERGAKLNDRAGATGETPLLLAVALGHADLASMLLERDADANIASTRGTAPLHAAVFSRNKALVQMLLDRGARLDAATPNGLTPLQLALKLEEPAIASILMSAGQKGAASNALPPQPPLPLPQTSSGNDRRLEAERVLADSRLREAESRARDQIEELQRQLESATRRRDELERLRRVELDALQTSNQFAISDLGARLTNSMSLADTLQRELVEARLSLKNRNEEQESERVSLKEQVDRINADMRKANLERDTIARQYEETLQKTSAAKDASIAALSARLAEQTTRLAELGRQLGASEEAVLRRQADAEVQSASFSNQITTLEKTIAIARDENVRLKVEMERTASDDLVGKLTKRIVALEKDLEAAGTENSAIKNRLAQAPSDEQIAKLVQQISGLEQDLAAARADSAELKDKLAKGPTDEQIGKMVRQISGLDRDLAAAREDSARLQEKLARSEKLAPEQVERGRSWFRRGNDDAALKARDRQIADLMIQLGALGQDVEAMTNALLEAEKDAVAKNAELERMRAEMQRLALKNMDMIVLKSQFEREAVELLKSEDHVLRLKLQVSNLMARVREFENGLSTPRSMTGDVAVVDQTMAKTNESDPSSNTLPQQSMLQLSSIDPARTRDLLPKPGQGFALIASNASNTTVRGLLSDEVRQVLDPAWAERKAYSCIMHVHTAFSSGRYSLPELTDIAAGKGVDAVFLSDALTESIEFGLFPLRHIFWASKQHLSVLKTGPRRYLEAIKAENQRQDQVLYVPGVELMPRFYWEGSLLKRNLVVNDHQRNLVVMGTDDPAFLETLPVANGFLPRRDTGWIILTRLCLVLFLAAVLSIPFLAPLLARRSGYSVGEIRRSLLLGLVTPLAVVTVLLNILLSFIPRFDIYDSADLPLHEQEIIDVLNAKNLPHFWAHPEESDVHELKVLGFGFRAYTRPYPDMLLQTKEFTGFAGLNEGRDGQVQAGSFWDTVLNDYILGRRKKPAWCYGEMLYHYEGQAGKSLDNVETMVWADDRSAANLLESLRSGLFYARRNRAGQALSLGVWKIGDAESGQTLQATGASVHLSLGVSARMPGEKLEVLIIRGGELLRKDTLTAPFEIDLEDTLPASALTGTFYRAVIIGRQPLRLITNPIFVQRLQTLNSSTLLAPDKGTVAATNNAGPASSPPQDLR